MLNFKGKIADTGYLDVTGYKLERSLFIDRNATLYFSSNTPSARGFRIELNEVAAIDDRSYGYSVSTIRLDSDPSSFGLDISIRAKNSEFLNFQLIYLFEDPEHTSPVFRGLARSINFHWDEEQH